MNFALNKIDYIDIHSHLQLSDYEHDRRGVIQRMRENKVATICVGVDLQTSREAKLLAENEANIFYSVGLHPHDNLEEFVQALKDEKKYTEKLTTLTENEKCLAIGECGLDYFYLMQSFLKGEISEEELAKEKERQEKVFCLQIELAQKLDLPVMLHIRPSETEGNKEDAYERAIEILQEYPEVRGDFHFFVGTKKVLESILAALPNFTVSIPAVCTFADEYDEMISTIPLNKIQLETDSPFARPKARRKTSKKNEPSFVIDVFEKVCELKNLEDKEEFREQLKENFRTIFIKIK